MIRFLKSLFNSSYEQETEFDREYEEFKKQREWEREVWQTAVQDWLIRSGLAEVMIEQTRSEYGNLEGIEQWPPEQLEHCMNVDFDPRRDDHDTIKEYVNSDPLEDKLTQ